MIQPTLSYLNDVYFGRGVCTALPEILTRYGLGAPLVVTDRSLRELGVVDRAGLSDAVVFDGVETNPSEAQAALAFDVFLSAKCDSVLAIGGGSSIDLAKVVALKVNHDGDLRDYAIVEGGPGSILGEVPPVVAVPTTAGSGSEVGRAALMTVDDGDKLGFLSPKLLPVAAVCDPELTLTMPRSLTAATGMDAISHCVEAILSPRENPVAGSLATDGLRRGTRAIKRAAEDGQDRDAREAMMWCSLLGGMAFQKGLGAVHSLSHPLGRLTHLKLHHGTLNALFLPHVIRYNASFYETSLQGVASAVGGVDPAAFFEDLLRALSLPRCLSDLGVTDRDLVSSAPLAAADHCTATNPRPMSETEALELYRRCL